MIEYLGKICGCGMAMVELRDDIWMCMECDTAPDYTETKIGDGTLLTVNPKPINWLNQPVPLSGEERELLDKYLLSYLLWKKRHGN